MSLRSKVIDENPEHAMEHARRYPLRITLLSLGVIAVLSNWLTVTVLGGSGPEVAGFEFWSGKLFFLLLIVLGAIDLFLDDPEYRRPAWLVGGLSLGILSVGSAIYIRMEIARAETEAGIFAGAFDASLGFGLWLAILVSVGALYVGYTMQPDGEDQPDPLGRMLLEHSSQSPSQSQSQSVDRDLESGRDGD